jgi:SAM-dependent methyltransferase
VLLTGGVALNAVQVASEWTPPEDSACPEWTRAAAEALPLPDGEFTAAVCQFGIQFFADRREALHEMLRVLRPGGRITVAVWDKIDNCAPYAVLARLVERIAGQVASDALRAPFVLGDLSEVVALLETAGVGSVTAATCKGTGQFPSVRSLVEADLRGWLPIMGVVLDEETIGAVLAEAESALAEFVTMEGDLVFESSAHIVSGCKPVFVTVQVPEEPVIGARRGLFV